MATYRELSYSILTGLKQTFPDRDFGLFEVLYHVQLAANPLLKQILQKHGPDGRYMSTYPGLEVIFDDVLQLPYVVIPQQVYDLQMEGGITKVWYMVDVAEQGCEPVWVQVSFQPTHFDTMAILYMNEYTKPTPKNPYFFRIQDNVYLVGVNKISCPKVNAVLYATLDPKDIVDLDSEIPLSDEYIEQVYYKVFNLGHFIANIPDERKLVGADKQWQEPAQKEQPIQQPQQQ